MEPSPDLINKNTGIEETSSVPTQASFFPKQKGIEDAIKNYKNVPVAHYTNESYFLFDKRDLIKKTFITALNKKILIYGSISYFNKKAENEIVKIITPEKFSKFYAEKDGTKNSLSISYQSLKTKKFTTFL